MYTEEAGRHLSRIETEKEKILILAREEGVKIVRNAEFEAKKKKEEIAKEAETKAEKIVSDGRKAVLAEKANMEKMVQSGAEELVSRALAKVLRKMEPELRDKALVSEAIKEIFSLKM